MYEVFSRQSLPSRKYRELVGTAVCVFNSNNGFIIENILREDDDEIYNWYALIDKTSGQLKIPIKETISKKSDDTIATLFEELVIIRNRIMHSFRISAPEGISSDNDNQMLATKYKDGNQVIITEEYLLDFIKKNEELSSKLHEFRGF
ncbi:MULTISPECIES: selenium binding protein [Pectobacteriaceae]|uniref:selenium binding protein n=1 Tax=Pectobacteriaceae TaxID=1903410 RepID=UPI001CF0FCE7|nr:MULTISPECIES: selenium binding protein [Pectobacteriaceae]MCA7013869.1 selenium binding protein [Dickeya dadantii]UUE56933.1 selenium binding protein [Pectobacterium aroidearum]UUE69639.1 selenium binding protein [Pectobacterium aroidearum]UUE74012.1 selenium binding protein [Pectobacterium aroidearum]UUE78346.1 selenium binding protein [Pectobacterium aroidearum]